MKAKVHLKKSLFLVDVVESLKVDYLTNQNIACIFYVFL